MTKLISGAGGGGGCFRAGTLIQQDKGSSISIESLKVGDTVLAFDENGTLHNAKVVEVHKHEEPEEIIRVSFWRGYVDITSNHWVLNQYNSFVEIGSLTKHDALVDGMNHLRPILKAEVIAVEPVYNLTVEPHHTFIANGIRVHNGGHRARHPIAGAGGGGGGGKGGGGGASHVPTESPDSLHSKQYAKVIDLICEGEIVGLVNGLKSVYLDDTPIESDDGIVNFTGITLDTRTGTQNQSYISGFSSVESETPVSTEVKNSNPVVRSVSNVNADALRITIGIPYLTYQSTNGDLGGTSVTLAIDINTNGGGWVEYLTDTISGKTTSRYQRNYRIELPDNGPWDIRVRRITEDSTQANLRNAFYWESYTEITDSKLRYPNSALVAISVDASQFNAIPKRGYDIKGLKVQVPSNYDPVTRIYTGIWDGTFSVAWTDNPAWCFYDLVTNDRYGLGAFIDSSQVDKWALYEISQYCDELVMDGFGGYEPRFTCNLYLQTREEAYKVINSLASIFRGMVYWAGGAIVAVQDSPSDPVALFSSSNIIGGQFNYQGSSAKARHTVALVSWNDPEDRYRQKIEYVEDSAGIERYGVIQTDILAVGCTSRGQAHRLGRWLLYTEQSESETINFRTGLEGLRVTPGSVIKTTDSTRSGLRRGGRIVSSSGTTIVIDDEVNIDSGKSYELWVTLPDGAIESRPVINGTGTTSSITVSSLYTSNPINNAMWVLSSSDLIPETWRVVSVVEVDSTQAEITALAYREDKYDAVEQDLILEPLATSIVDPLRTPDPVTDIHIDETLYLITNSIVGTRATISWYGNSPMYEIRYRKANENWQLRTSTSNSIDIQPVEAGNYEFSIVAMNALGIRSNPTAYSTTIYGLTKVPNDVTNFNILSINGNAHLSWDASTDLDVIVAGSLRVRYTTDTVAPEWSNAIDIGPKLAGSSTNAVLPLLSGTYMAKWIDSSGNESYNATSIITNATDIVGMNAVANVIEHPAFTGTKSNTFKTDLGLILDSAHTIDEELTLIDTWPLISLIGGVATSGEYYFDDTIDLGSVQISRLTGGIASLAYDTSDLMDDRLEVDTWTYIDGGVVSDAGCTIYVRTTNDNPLATPTWSSWVPFVVGDWTARAFQFKAVLYSNYSTHNILVTELYVTVDMPDRLQSGDDIATAAATKTVTYTLPFMAIPAIGISAQNMANGDYYQITNKTPSSFDITFKNSAGTNISRTFDYIARGY